VTDILFPNHEASFSPAGEMPKAEGAYPTTPFTASRSSQC
jgi:hypothetical protein